MNSFQGPTAELSDSIEGGNVDRYEYLPPGEFRVWIRKDTNGSSFRWYSFLVKGCRGKPLTFRLMNAGQATASDSWSHNRPFVSSDGGATWQRIPDGSFADGVFSFHHVPQSGEDWIATGPSYGPARWGELLAGLDGHPVVRRLETVARSSRGFPIQFLEIHEPSLRDAKTPTVWVIARQHPSEVAGSWVLEGFIRWLLGDDPEAGKARVGLSFSIMGFMNPDGALLGNYRVDAYGQDLAQSWAWPDPDRVPSVAAAQELILSDLDARGGVSVVLDFHAHSTIRDNFGYFAFPPDPGAVFFSRLGRLIDALSALNPDFAASRTQHITPSGRSSSMAWVVNVAGIPVITFEASSQDISVSNGESGYMTVERYLRFGEDIGRAVFRALISGWSFFY